MKKNYLILAHKNPQQLLHMINALNDQNSNFFIHLDAKTDINPFLKEISLPNVLFIEDRINCIWADFSIVDATINLIRHAIKNEHEGFLILLSGQDFPIKSKKQFNSFLEKNKDKNFIYIKEFEKMWTPDFVYDKLYNYQFFNHKKNLTRCYPPMESASFSEKIRIYRHLIKGKLLFEHFKVLKKNPKRSPLFEKQWCGSQWWALNWKTSELLLQFIEKNYNSLKEYYKYTCAPDEIFFHSIIKHLQKNHEIVLEPSITYVDWSQGKNHPKTLTKDDLDKLLNLEKFYLARKFDCDLDSQIINLLENNIKE